MSTLALVASCTASERVEVHGVVTDLRTGEALSGARVTGAHGVATHTDRHGHFTLTVVRGIRTQLRVSAEGHTDVVQGIEAEVLASSEDELAFQLAPSEETRGSEAVVRWVPGPRLRAAFHSERDAASVDAPDGQRLVVSCPAPWVGRRDVPDEGTVAWLGAGAECVECHAQLDVAFDTLRGEIPLLELSAAPHGYLADACLACHAEGRSAADQCGRCHDDTEVEVTSQAALSSRYEDVVARARQAMQQRLTPSTARAWMEWLERDASRGAHNPQLVRLLDQAVP